MTTVPQARVQHLAVYQQEASSCTRCRDLELLHQDHRGTAYPVLQRNPTGTARVLLVGEAPNADDTYDPDKRYLTYDRDTDPTGQFMRELLVDVVGLRIDDVLFTNAVLCLPRAKDKRFPVTAKMLDACRPLLVKLIEAADPKVVVAMGGKALVALKKVEKHELTLKDAGKPQKWFGRYLLPVYHAGLLGRISRPAEKQRADIRALADLLR